MIIEIKWLPVGGIALPPLIVVRNKQDTCLIVHEETHVEQCRNMSQLFGKTIWPLGWIRWGSKYIYDFLVTWIATGSFYTARHIIPYEEEAYDRQRECLMDLRKGKPNI